MVKVLEWLGIKRKKKEEEVERVEEKVEKKEEKRLLSFWSIRPLTENEEEELLDNLAGVIVKYGMETPAIFFLETYKPLSFIMGHTVLLPSAPFFEIFGFKGYEYTSLFMKKKNVDRLIKKLEEAQKKGLSKA